MSGLDKIPSEYLTQIANQIIQNSMHEPRIQALVEKHGYSAGQLEIAQQLSTRTQLAVETQKQAAKAAQSATAEVQRTKAQARAIYQVLVQTARAVFPAGSTERAFLVADGPTPNDTRAFIAAANMLFKAAIDDHAIAATLQHYGFDDYKVRAGRDAIGAYQAALQARSVAQSRALEATRDKRAAVVELRRWLAQYLKIARIALAGNRELLKALGIPRSRVQPQQYDSEPAKSMVS